MDSARIGAGAGVWKVCGWCGREGRCRGSKGKNDLQLLAHGGDRCQLVVHGGECEEEAEEEGREGGEGAGEGKRVVRGEAVRPGEAEHVEEDGLQHERGCQGIRRHGEQQGGLRRGGEGEQPQCRVFKFLQVYEDSLTKHRK